MAYTEIKVRNGRRYYYRAISVRRGASVSKQRKYLGSNLSKKDITSAEILADQKFGLAQALLTIQDVAFLERIKLEHARLPPETYQERYEAFAAKFTHNSTAIEGNTLTLQETERLLFEDIAPAGKSFREICEVVGHGKGFDKILERDNDFSRKSICELHSLVMKDTISPKFRAEVGQYRSVPVYISGLDWTPPAPETVPYEMGRLLSWYSRKREKLHPLVLAVYFHVNFETIHPFIDGNGRHILHREGFPMVSIPSVLKYRYYDVLEKARQIGDLRPFLEFLLELFEEDGAYF
jgi:Fic family protein